MSFNGQESYLSAMHQIVDTNSRMVLLDDQDRELHIHLADAIQYLKKKYMKTTKLPVHSGFNKLCFVREKVKPPVYGKKGL